MNIKDLVPGDLFSIDLDDGPDIFVGLCLWNYLCNYGDYHIGTFVLKDKHRIWEIGSINDAAEFIDNNNPVTVKLLASLADLGKIV